MFGIPRLSYILNCPNFALYNNISTIFEGRVTSAPERKEGRARLDKRNERERQSNI